MSSAIRCLLLLVLLTPLRVEAQVAIRIPPPDVVQRMVLIDGSVLLGRVESTEDPVRFRMTSGASVDVPQSAIRAITLVEGEVIDGEFWLKDPNDTRLFFGPTARTQAAGSGYFSVFELVAPTLAFAATDDLVLAGGTPLWIGGDANRVFWFAPN